ncbi:hypothetical protein [Paractinoplanes toevensis]|uniref:hypothetical protein n=1 Tax=Paractinoplanes toevensis TaxID=571911 RepID=UPI001BB38894|nr:hypothetical protein [Actinoplanes toevensis]
MISAYRRIEMEVYGGSVPSGESPPNSAGSPDPGRVYTLPELADALNLLRARRSYSSLDKAVGGEPAKKRHALAPSTISDLIRGKSIPSPDTVVTFLSACGLATDAQQPWLAALERVSTAHLRRPPGAVRVRDADPRRLGVHASIQLEGGADELPPYVPRDLDADLRTAITAASRRGGFVLVRGSSSVGKSRSMLEAIRAALPEWWLLQPADAAAVRAIADTAVKRTVVWLDELQRYLNEPGGLPIGAVRALLDAGLVVAATLWPAEYAARVASRTPAEPDPYDNDRALLRLARVVDVPDALTSAERDRAERLGGDPRIRVALGTRDAGFTQVLAAGPELVRWWEHADVTDPRQCYGKAVITASLDARRIGEDAPLTREFLFHAAPAYVSDALRAQAPDDWLEQAITYATTRMHGATGCLSAVSAGMGQIAGWITADFLYQRACLTRRAMELPDVVWRALADHQPGDAMRLTTLASRASARGRSELAAEFMQRAADCGDPIARQQVALAHSRELVEQGRIDDLRRRAETDEFARLLLAEFLAGEGREQELRKRAAEGNVFAHSRLLRLLEDNGRWDDLAQLADAGDIGAALRLADVLAARGKTAELQRRADAGQHGMADRLQQLRISQETSLEVLRGQLSKNDFVHDVRRRIAELLAGQGHLDELRQLADAQDVSAMKVLAGVLLERRDLEGLRSRSDAGDWAAGRVLADALEEQRRTDDAITVLRKHAGVNDGAAAELCELLAKHQRRTELWAEVGAGTFLAYRIWCSTFGRDGRHPGTS